MHQVVAGAWMPSLTEIVARWFGFVRLGNWWFSKIPPLVAVGYLEILRLDVDFQRAALLLACFIFSVSCVATYGHVVNDIFDIDADRRAGRHNSMAHVNWSGRILICLAVLFGGFAPALILDYSALALLLLSLNYLWPTIYSLPGIRLKERGLIGVICDAMGSHITPTLFALSIFGTVSPPQSAGQFWFALTVTLWAAVLGIKGILHHQIADRDNDIRSGAVTFATNADPEWARHFLARFNLWVELPVSAALVFVVYGWCPLAAVAFFAYCALETLKFFLGFRFSLNSDARTIRANVPFTNELFYVLWLPLAAAIQVGGRGQAWSWLPILHVALFYRMAMLQIRELKSIIQIAGRSRWLRRINSQ